MELNKEQLWAAIKARHSVRQYQAKPIPEEVRDDLNAFVRECNEKSGLNLFIRYDDPTGFDSRLAHYGSFRGVGNYIVLSGKRSKEFDFDCGYYGEKIAIYAQHLGLNTCWTAMTFNRGAVKSIIPEGEKMCMVLSLGYGENAGRPHKGKSYEDVVTKTVSEAPEWFKEGVRSALLAPTATNQQKFEFGLENGEASIRIKGLGSCTKVDLGIVAYHFEAVSDHIVSH